MRGVTFVALLAAFGCDDTEPASNTEPGANTETQSSAKASTKVPAGAQGGQSPVQPVSPESLRKLHPWRDISDAQLAAELDAAYALAKEENKKVLLDFVASWCHDCVEVLKVAEQKPASTVIAERYVYIPVNVGDFDRAESLRKAYDIKKIATLVVLDAERNRIAQSTLEPISKKQKLSPQALAAWLKAPSDESSPLQN